MQRNNQVLAIIPARHGSSRLPNKNMKEIESKPLIAHTIEQAIEASSINETIIFSDIPNMQKLADLYGVRFIKEPEKLAKENVPGMKLIRYVLNTLETEEHSQIDVIAYLQPTSPLRRAKHINEALNLFINSDADSLASLCQASQRPEWMYSLEKPGDELIKYTEEVATGHYNAIPLFHLNGAIFLMRTSSLKKIGDYYLGGKAIGYLMNEDVSIDIDTETEFEFAKFIMEKRNERN
jgi:CMP-N,N'-diacetyllegionaminic acid synthase